MRKLVLTLTPKSLPVEWQNLLSGAEVCNIRVLAVVPADEGLLLGELLLPFEAAFKVEDASLVNS